MDENILVFQFDAFTHAFVLQCKKTNVDDCPICPKITMLTHSHGHGGDTIKITGENFNPAFLSNVVHFNGSLVADSDMISGNATELIVRVPSKCGTGKVSVAKDADLVSATSPLFTYDYELSVSTFSSLWLSGPHDIVFNPVDKCLYIAESGKHCILKCDKAGNISVYAGKWGDSGYANSSDRLQAQFNNPEALTCDSSGNLYVADSYNNCIRRIINGGPVETFCGTNTSGDMTGSPGSSRFHWPSGICISNGGHYLYVSDRVNNKIIRINVSDGTSSPYSGSGVSGHLDGSKLSAQFGTIYHLTIDDNDILYVTEQDKQYIRQVATNGYASTIAGTGISGYIIDTLAIHSPVNHPVGINYYRLKGQEILYVFDGNRIRQITMSHLLDFAGTGNSGSSDGSITQATFSSPRACAFDDEGNMYVADAGNGLIRKITLD